MFFFHFDVVLVAELLPLFGATTQYILFVLCAVWTKRERAESTLAILPFSVGRIIRPIFFAPNVCFFFHFFFFAFLFMEQLEKKYCRTLPSIFTFLVCTCERSSYFLFRPSPNSQCRHILIKFYHHFYCILFHRFLLVSHFIFHSVFFFSFFILSLFSLNRSVCETATAAEMQFTVEK